MVGLYPGKNEERFPITFTSPQVATFTNFLNGQ